MKNWMLRSMAMVALFAMFVLLCPAVFANGSKETAATAPGFSSTSAGVSHDPFGKYDPPISFRFVIPSTDGVKFDSVDTPENNFWTRKWLSLLGVKGELMWATPSAQFQQKWQLTLASGDLPDILPLNKQEFSQFQQAGKLADLSQVYKDYGSPLVKEMYDRDAGATLGQLTVNGKLYGFGWASNAVEAAHLVWVRTDWLKRLNLPEPRTMADFQNIAQAFATKDPDGNGRNDTIGYTINKDLFYGWQWALGGIDGFFNGFHSYPTYWIKDTNGKLVYGGIQPEARSALQKLAEMYKSGAIDPEFGVKDSQKILEEVTAGQIGLIDGPYWHPEYPIIFNMQRDPKATWRAYPLPSADGIPAKAGIDADADSHIVGLRADYPHPELIVKLLNVFTKVHYASPDEFTAANKVEFANPVNLSPPLKNIYEWKHLTEDLKTNNTSNLNGEELARFRHAQGYLSGDKSLWPDYAMYTSMPDGVPGGFDIITSNYMDKGLLVQDAFNGLPTDTMVKRGSTLEKMQKEAFTKAIVTGDIGAFDSFVENWKKAGGDQMTQEVNAWYTANPAK